MGALKSLTIPHKFEKGLKNHPVKKDGINPSSLNHVLHAFQLDKLGWIYPVFFDGMISDL